MKLILVMLIGLLLSGCANTQAILIVEDLREQRREVLELYKETEKTWPSPEMTRLIQKIKDKVEAYDEVIERLKRGEKKDEKVNVGHQS